jgi:hypothetical protein
MGGLIIFWLGSGIGSARPGSLFLFNGLKAWGDFIRFLYILCLGGEGFGELLFAFIFALVLARAKRMAFVGSNLGIYIFD